MSRKLQKLTHKYEFLKFELEEVEESLEGYMVEWNKYFGKYFRRKNDEIWVNEETGEIRHDEPVDHEAVKTNRQTRRTKPSRLKKLYKEISKHTHPDKGGDPELFKKVQEVYEDEDLIELLKYAGLYKVDFEIEEDDEVMIEKSCSDFQNKIEVHKNSMAWAYFTGDKNKKLAVIKMLESFLKQEIKKEDYPPELLEND
jgi:hypothetical protein